MAKKILLVFFFFSINVFPQNYGKWTNNVSLIENRSGHASVVLQNGDILVTGGYGHNYEVLSSCEILDAKTNSFRKTTEMINGHAGHNAVLLPNGEVLVIGTQACEIYNPATEKWSIADSTKRYRKLGYKVVKLKDGKIMLIGGYNASEEKTSFCEIFDPITKRWSQVASLNFPRCFFAATLLNNGKILVSDGNSISSEIYDPLSNKWKVTDFLKSVKEGQEQILISNGNVLLLGGENNIEIAIFDTKMEKWTYPNSSLIGYRQNPGVFKISDDKLLIVGGEWHSATTWEIYDLIKMQSIHSEDMQISYSSLSSSIISTNIGSSNMLKRSNGKIIIIGYEFYDHTYGIRSLHKECYTFDIKADAMENYQTLNKYMLGQNYPNPFNPTTEIVYQLEKTGKVKITVYDILGRNITRLVNETKSAGYYKVNFNAENLPSGVYIYRMQVGDFISTRKMVLIK